MSNDFYSKSDHNVQCDFCGAKRKRSQCRLQWDGLLACTVNNCYSPKHPNEYSRPVINDGLPVSNARPRVEVANANFLRIGGTTRWSDITLRFSKPDWLWSDDLSHAELLKDGNP